MVAKLTLKETNKTSIHHVHRASLTRVDGRVEDGLHTVVGDGEGGAALRHGAGDDGGGDGGGDEGQEAGLNSFLKAAPVDPLPALCLQGDGRGRDDEVSVLGHLLFSGGGCWGWGWEGGWGRGRGREGSWGRRWGERIGRRGWR